MFVSGRVLSNPPVPAGAADHAWWRNLVATLRHLETDEVPGAHVRLRLERDVRDAVTDDEGFFRAWLTPDATPGAGPLRRVDAEVLDGDGTAVVAGNGTVVVPGPGVEYGVISDIDDTVIRTDATRLLRMLRRTLLENARTRLPFPGVAEFYRALRGGATGAAENPVFYVSSSPWNLYAVITEFLEHHGIPSGPLMLRDWGISERGMLPTGHGEHKLGAIRQILDCYASLPFILMGDSGQEDPEIYRDVVRLYGGRVHAVFIRDVTGDAVRRRTIGELAEEVRRAGSVLLLSDDTAAAARHAALNGWIRGAAAAEVERAVSSSGSRPG